MNKTLTLIIGIIALVNVGYSFFNTSYTAEMFNIEMNIWVYRFIWFTLAVFILRDYFQKRKLRE